MVQLLIENQVITIPMEYTHSKKILDGCKEPIPLNSFLQYWNCHNSIKV